VGRPANFGIPYAIMPENAISISHDAPRRIVKNSEETTLLGCRTA
jgi:hypothetical protein